MRKINKIFGTLLPLLAVAAFCLSNTACQPEDLVDNTEFALYYPGITDIGPSTPLEVSPTYIGEKPSDFKITKLTLDGKAIYSECFTLNEDSGLFRMKDTENLAVGLYKISISCVSAGKTWNFADIIKINMMKPIPEGISVEPAELTLPLTDITEPAQETKLPTAQIVTEGEHISIKGYRIAGARRNGAPVDNADELFAVSSSGEVSILGSRNFLPGIYVIDFRLVTFVVDAESEEGIFENALTVNVTSAPKALSYSPSKGEAEVGVGWTFDAPVVAGSLDELKFSITGVKKMDKGGISSDLTEEEIRDNLAIDETSGAISVLDGHSFADGDVLTLSLNVSNKYGNLSVSRAFVIEVISFIAPITKFEYEDVNIVQIQAFKAAADCDGDKLSFSFVEPDPVLAEYLILDEKTGEVSAAKYHEIPTGTYPVKLMATNRKGSLETELSLTVAENPNYFTYFHYGNNLGLGTTEAEIVAYPSQHRIGFEDTDAKTAECPISYSDIKENSQVKFTLEAADDAGFWLEKPKQHSVDADGKISFNFDGAKRNIQVCRIVATAGDDETTSVTRETLVFVHLSQTIHDMKIEFTPFVVRVNPKTGSVKDLTKLSVNGTETSLGSPVRVDYRGDQRFANLNGPESHVDGRPADAGSFLKTLWDLYKANADSGSSDSARNPVSLFADANKSAADQDNNKARKLLYMDNSDNYQLKVNTKMVSKSDNSVSYDIWKNSDGYVNGLYIGQMVFSDDALDPNANFGTSANRKFHNVVWFDEKF